MGNGKHKLDSDELQAFLLGELEEAETSRIESMFLSDVNLEDALEQAKRHLFDAYSTGALSPERSGRFEKRFLQEALADDKKAFQDMIARNERDRDDVEGDANEEAKAFGITEALGSDTTAVPKAAPKSAAKGVQDRSEEKAQRSAPASGAPRKDRQRLLVAAAIFLVGALGVGAYFYIESQKVSAGPTVELQGFNRRGKSLLAHLPANERLTLKLQVVGAEGVTGYRLRLFLKEDSDESVDVPVLDADKNFVYADLDAASLAKGRYDLELSGERDGAKVVIAYYSVKR